MAGEFRRLDIRDDQSLEQQLFGCPTCGGVVAEGWTKTHADYHRVVSSFVRQELEAPVPDVRASVKPLMTWDGSTQAWAEVEAVTDVQRAYPHGSRAHTTGKGGAVHSRGTIGHNADGSISLIRDNKAGVWTIPAGDLDHATTWNLTLGEPPADAVAAGAADAAIVQQLQAKIGNLEGSLKSEVEVRQRRDARLLDLDKTLERLSALLQPSDDESLVEAAERRRMAFIAVQEDVRQARRDIALKVKVWGDAVDLLQAERDQLRVERDEASAAASGYSKEVGRLARELKATQESGRLAEQDLNEVQELNVRACAERDELQVRLTASKEANADLLANHKSACAERDQAVKLNQELSDALAAERASNTRLRQELNTANDDRSELSHMIQRWNSRGGPVA